MPKSKELVTVNKGALATSVGPAAIAELAKLQNAERKAEETFEHIYQRRDYDIPAAITEAIVKAARADKAIDLSNVYGTKEQVTTINAQVCIVLGIREYDDKDKLIWSKAVRKYFPAPGDKADDEATMVKASFRTNFLHKLRLCIQAAHAIVSKEIDMKRSNGTLLLTGKAVEKTFGAPSVLLNERQTQNEVELKARPSFAATARLGAPENKKATAGNTRVAKEKPTGTTPQEAVRSIGDSLLRALNKVRQSPIEPETRLVLNNVVEAIEEVLGGVESL